MKKPLRNVKSAFVTGLLIVLPAWLAILLSIKLLVKLGVIVKPISQQMPEGVNHPHLVAAIFFLFLCLLVGSLVHTAIGRVIGRSLRENIFTHIPGYQSLCNISRQFGDQTMRDGFQPALIDVEDGCLTPAFLIEDHANGRSTVFMPSVPTPMAGSILIMPSERVYPIDVPVTAMMKCISKWGAESGELLNAYFASSKDHPPQ